VYGSAPVEQAALHTFNAAPGFFAVAQTGYGLFGQETEMIRFAEELRFVRGHDVDEVDRFGGEPILFEQEIAVLLQVRHAGGAQPATQPALDHGDLRRGHFDAAVALDEGRQPLKIALAEVVRTAVRCCH
jgi:hypothetical protein